jgi:hypothetical protein
MITLSLNRYPLETLQKFNPDADKTYTLVDAVHAETYVWTVKTYN